MLLKTETVPQEELLANRTKFEQAEEAFQSVKTGWLDVFEVTIEGVQSMIYTEKIIERLLSPVV
ncbi:hypothetical protein F4775DRAFT_526177 [Biscogniauxia sp. FL1348]|nr:hypothetical protein F4775DRAFT_526177 [Biscogniauxia sp. FL1348]